MTTATIFKAKTNLSELIQKAKAGEEVIITSGRERTPVAKLEAIPAATTKPLGFLEHLNLDLPDSFFFDPMPEEELQLWEGADEDK